MKAAMPSRASRPRLRGDRLRLELHLRLERFREAVMEEPLCRAVRLRCPAGEFLRQRFAFGRKRAIREHARDETPFVRFACAQYPIADRELERTAHADDAGQEVGRA